MVIRSLQRQGDISGGYDHARWEPRRQFLRFLLRTLGTLFFKIDRVDGLENVPAQGSAILMINHIAFMDSIVVLHSVHRNIVPFAKEEVYSYPLIGLITRLWGVIPVRRGEVDRRALRRALEVLRSGEIILLAPEGTRSTQLQKGREGIAYIASRSNAPIVPVAIEHTQGFPSFPLLPRWRQPGARVQFGRAFRYRPEYLKPSRDQLRQMTDEALYLLAALLPEQMRGVYADLSEATQETIQWE